MCPDFLSLRVRLGTSAAISAEVFASPSSAPGKCWQNVKQLIDLHGGTFVYGWAFAGLGPIAAFGEVQPLYSRWCNHVLWRDKNDRLWEVTPSGDPVNVARVAFGPTIFILDDQATFEVATEGVCCPQ